MLRQNSSDHAIDAVSRQYSSDEENGKELVYKMPLNSKKHVLLVPNNEEGKPNLKDSRSPSLAT